MPVAGLLSGALVWGLIWYPYRALQDAGISGALATGLTYAFALLCGAFVLPRLWRERASLNGWVLLILLGAGWANLGYVMGMLYGDVMRVLLLFYLAPVWTILFSFWLLDEKLDKYGYAIIGLSLAGALIMLWKPELGLPIPHSVSDWMGLTAGMGFALSNVVTRRSTHLSLEVKASCQWVGTLTLSLPFLWWQGGMLQQMDTISLSTWGLLLLMGLVLCTTSFAVQYGVTHMAANRAVVLFLFELVVAAISAWFLAAESMNLREWLGAALIVSATLLTSRMYQAEEESAATER
ncbi:MAG: DMT family transporter [Gammaproteobacteria bacterium]|nr:DMT family transporter [Gammaproteobacteria bacterium]MBU1625274.1 DMT family transporter [Gammaproteobacteria bacterium]MBU1981534.1 DMT family transporter [Gammaproteobacteria bacterium]